MFVKIIRVQYILKSMIDVISQKGKSLLGIKEKQDKSQCT